MSFQPVLPLSGYAGYQFLTRTMESQREAFNESAVMARDTDYFRENISKITSAQELVDDRRLLTVALGAFGLSDDINSRAFILEVLEEGTIDDDALANKLSDSRYKALSKEFSFGDLGGLTAISGFADKIIDRYENHQFEVAVGEQNDTFRQALNVGNALNDVLSDFEANDSRWFAIMGSPPLRSVFQSALGIPASFASVDIDEQLVQFKKRAESYFGTSDVSDFDDPEMQEKLVRLFLVRDEISNFSMSGASAALSLLQSSTFSYK